MIDPTQVLFCMAVIDINLFALAFGFIHLLRREVIYLSKRVTDLEIENIRYRK